MSIEAISWALNDAPVSDQGQLLILLGLANHATKDGERAFPSVATLAEYARCSVRTVHRHLKALEESGVIVRGDQDWIPPKIPGNRRPVVYDLRMDLKSGVTPVAGLPNLGVTLEAPRGDSGGNSGVTTVADKPSFFLTEETVLEPSVTQTQTSGKGKRLPQGFEPTPEMMQWCGEKGLDVGWDDHEAFVDYWTAQPGSKGMKADWEATWRGWMRRAAAEKKRRSPMGRQAIQQAETDALFDRAMQRAKARDAAEAAGQLTQGSIW